MGTVTAKRVNVRSGAGTTFSALGQVEQGTRISVTGWNNEWYKFTFNGKDAYIKGRICKAGRSAHDCAHCSACGYDYSQAHRNVRAR